MTEYTDYQHNTADDQPTTWWSKAKYLTQRVIDYMTDNKVVRLAQAAKDINVSIETAAQHLKKKGFDVDVKPTTKLSPEMYELLLRDFKGDIALKERAEQISLRHKPDVVLDSPTQDTPVQQPLKVEEETPKAPPPIISNKETPPPTPEPDPEHLPTPDSNTTAPPLPTQEVVTPPTPIVETLPPPVEEVISTPIAPPVQVEVEIETETETPPLPIVAEKEEMPIADDYSSKLPKIVGKIDLPTAKGKPEKTEPKKKITPPTTTPEPQKNTTEPAKKPKKVPVITQTPPPVAQPQDKEEGTDLTVQQIPEQLPPDDRIERTKVTLSGPTVVGKIDLSVADRKPTAKDDDKDDRKKRKRKRIVKPLARENQPDVEQTSEKPPKELQRAKPKEKEKEKRRENAPSLITNKDKEAIRDKEGKPLRGDALQTNKKKGKKDKRQTTATDSEVSDKEIQSKIRATQAKMSGGKAKSVGKLKKKQNLREQEASRREAEDNEPTKTLQVTEFIAVNELARLMDVSVAQVITACFSLGIMVSINQRLDAEVIELVAGEFGFEVQFINVAEAEEKEEEIDDPESLLPRPPIVTIMGHVDHGKTSLLDYIRNASVVAGEMGGITQHIGAYEVTTSKGKQITFLDTPGHEAFTAMRARGAKVTDIAVIVIAADDSVMPQTREAISHAQAANIPMIFAINKIDKPDANSQKIYEQLASMNILVEEWGGKYQSQEISAKKGLNIDVLLDKILLEAEILELTANPNRHAVGTVIEASLDKGRGFITTILVQTGTLKISDIILSGTFYGRVKAMFNERGGKVTTAGPSTPVLVLGLDGAPQAGDKVRVMDSEQEAKQIATQRGQIMREQQQRAQKHITLDEISRRRALGNFKELNLIIKGDVDGSVEALSDSLLKLSTEEIQVKIIHRSVGAITESDVLLASASDAIILGFQVRPTPNARKRAENEHIDIRMYSIIYNAIEEIRAAMEGMLEPKVEERFVCSIDVRQVFKITKVGTVAGCVVTEGRVHRDTKVRLLRDGIVVYTGTIETLKRFKDDVKEVLPGQECGIALKNFNDLKSGDVIEGYDEIEIKRRL